MTDVCVGGLYDGMVIQGLEDRNSCVENEGRVQSRGGSCISSNISALAFNPSLDKSHVGALGELLLLPLRLLRSSLGDSSVVAALDGLNDSFAPALEKAIAKNEHLKGRLVTVLVGVSYFASAMLQSGKTEGTARPVFTESLHNKMKSLAKDLDAFLDVNQRKALEFAMASAQAFVGKDAITVDEILRRDLGGSQIKQEQQPNGFRDPLVTNELTDTFTSRFSGGLDSIIAEVNNRKHSYPETLILDESYKGPSIGALLQDMAAEQRIASKAAAIGGLAGGPVGDTQTIGPGQYSRKYQGADIYYSDKTGAHEVHGDILAKYNALGGPLSVLGLPTTDEMGCADAVGRFNDFEHGSIYWAPTIGPMMTHTAIRDNWVTQGAEHGFLGYPVADQHKKVFRDPAAQPAAFWEFFENGAIFGSRFEIAPALVAELTPPKLATLVRQFFDKAFHDAGVTKFGPLQIELGELGIEGGLNILSVSNWSYNFWQSVPRYVTYEINGFMKNPIVPDATFRLEVTLEFGLSWPNSFTEPAWKTLIVSLIKLHVHTSGVGNGPLFSGLTSQILEKFKEPVAVKDIPVNGSKLMGILLTKQGGLQILLEPTLGNPDFTLNRVFVQQELDNLVPD
jgi:hypothetical protein